MKERRRKLNIKIFRVAENGLTLIHSPEEGVRLDPFQFFSNFKNHLLTIQNFNFKKKTNKIYIRYSSGNLNF